MISGIYRKFFLAFACTVYLSGCSGGGGSGTPTSDIDYDIEIFQYDNAIGIGESTELILLATSNELTDILWTQVDGPDVEFYARNTKVISFTPQESGSYSFDVQYRIDGSQIGSLSHTFSVTDEIAPVTVRLGHAVIEGNSVSLTGFADNDDQSDQISKETWRWEQIQGTAVTFTSDNTDGDSSVYFDAPDVNVDTVLRFRLTAEINGNSVSDEIAILVEDSDIDVPDSGPFRSRVATVYPYVSGQQNGQTLVDCVYSNEARYDVCTFEDTPLIAQVTTSPTVQDIMNKVLVSHDWMGSQFEKFLQEHDEFDDFKNLLRAVTAVVISYDIRPSFYSPTSGAIYLDPDDLWVTPAQRDTINSAPDYRSGFGSELQFEMPWRYVKDNDYAYYFYPSRYRISRTLEDSKYSFAALLYHELAHANDFFPSSRWLTYPMSKTVYDAVNEVYQAQQIQSDYLQNNFPLVVANSYNGVEMQKLAQVRFRDPDAIQEYQKDFTMSFVADMFKTEGAPQFYSYSTTREDFAILFDGFMMYARYGINRDVGVSDQQYNSFVWGQRDRKGESWIKPRIEFVTNRVLPEFYDADAIIQNMPEPLVLDNSVNWRSSVVVSPDDSSESELNISVRDKRLTPMDGEIWHFDHRQSHKCGAICVEDVLKNE